MQIRAQRKRVGQVIVVYHTLEDSAYIATSLWYASHCKTPVASAHPIAALEYWTLTFAHDLSRRVALFAIRDARTNAHQLLCYRISGTCATCKALWMQCTCCRSVVILERAFSRSLCIATIQQYTDNNASTCAMRYRTKTALWWWWRWRTHNAKIMEKHKLPASSVMLLISDAIPSMRFGLFFFAFCLSYFTTGNHMKLGASLLSHCSSTLFYQLYIAKDRNNVPRMHISRLMFQSCVCALSVRDSANNFHMSLSLTFWARMLDLIVKYTERTNMP